MVLGVFAYILWNTLRSRPARTALTVPLVLTVVGVAGLAHPATGHTLRVSQGVLLGVILLFDAVGLGALRAGTVHLWSEAGQLWMRGTWVTVALWIAGITIHILADRAAGIGEATSALLLYLGLSWMAQRLVLDARARRSAAL